MEKLKFSHNSLDICLVIFNLLVHQLIKDEKNYIEHVNWESFTYNP